MGNRIFPAAVCILILCSLSPVHGDGNVRFEHIKKEKGLSSLSVSSIVQDQRGFLWFGTQGGLNRYDGYEFKVYKNEPFNANSLSHDLIQTLYMDKDHTLWVGTYNGLNKLNTLTGDVRRYIHDPEDQSSLSGSVVVSVLRDSRGELWVGTLEGLNRLNEETGEFTRFLHDPDNPGSLSSNTVRDIYEDSSGRLWIATYDGLNRYHREENRFSAYRADCEFTMTLGQSRNGHLWVGTWGGAGLYDFDINSKSFTPYPLPDERAYSLETNGDGSLLVGTWGGGLVELDAQSGKVTSHHTSSNEDFNLSHDIVYSLHRDRAGILWAGTNGGGINKMVAPENEFTYYGSDPDDPDSLSKGKVNAVFVDDRDNLWVGMYNGGLNRYDAEGERMVHYRAHPETPSSLSNDIVTDIFQDSEGTLWICTNGGLNRYNYEEDDFEVFHKGDPPFYLQDDIVYKIIEDVDGFIWIGTYSSGLTRYNPRTGEVSHYRSNAEDPHSVSDNLIYDFLVDKEGLLWIATNNGLNRYDEERDRFITYFHDESDLNSLTSNTIREIFEDSDGRIWIGTVSGGLLRYHREEDNFSFFMEEQGLPDNSVFGILEDFRGRLWISTSDTLAIFTPGEERFQRVDEDNGIWAEEFTRGHARDTDGRVYFGTTKGLYRIEPRDFKRNTHVPPVYLTSFEIFGKEAELEKPLTEVESLSITHKDRYIAFEFAALDYVSPEKNRYAYRLEGFDNEWIESGNRRHAGYTNLPPGEYTFRVKASNNDNVWNEEGLSVGVRVIPPPWRTGWAYAGYVTAGILFIAGLTFLFNREQRRKYERHTQEIERKRLAELEVEIKEKTKAQREMLRAKEEAERANRAKSDFIGNMSHEIRTPMNAIIGYSQLIEDEVKEPTVISFLDIIQKNGRQLLELIDELLDLSVVEAGQLKVNPSEVDVPSLMEDTAAVYVGKAKEKNVELSVSVREGTPRKVFLDEMRIRQVLYNLIGNALKFTERGYVRVEASTEKCDSLPEEEEDLPGQKEKRLEKSTEIGEGGWSRYCYRFTVEDTGIGIPEEEKKRIFDAFTQKEGQSEIYGGTGLGLAISKRLVEAMGGVLKMRSSEGIGSIFIVEFPDLPAAETVSTQTAAEETAAEETASPEIGSAGEASEKKDFGDEDSVDSKELVKFFVSGDEEDVRRALPQLEGELKDRWASISGTMFIEEWRTFARDLYSIGTENNLSGLREYAQEILDKIQDFEIEKLKELFYGYPSLLKEYKKRAGE
ncbi:MAG: two-component regulator propeller domain-containing protein [Spirochaetia bacterium]